MANAASSGFQLKAVLALKVVNSFCFHTLQGGGPKPLNYVFSPVVRITLSVLALAFLLSAQKTNAATVQIKFPADSEASTQFSSSTGAPLYGNLIRVGAFKTDPVALFVQTATLTDASEILDKIESQFLLFGSFNFDASFSIPHEPFFQLSEEPTAQLSDLNTRDVFLLLYNAEPKELAIFRSKDAKFDFGSVTSFELGVSGVELLIGFYSFAADRWETGQLAGGVGRIFSPTNETIEAGDVATFFIRANHGANHFAVTNLQVSTNGGVSFSNIANSWISVATNTGALTLAAPENDTNRYRITLIASNTVTAVSASNTLQLTLLQPTGPDFGTSNNQIVVKAGVAFTTNLPANRAARFTNVGTLPGWLTFSNQAPGTLVLGGTPPLIATNRVRFRAIDATNTNQTRSRELAIVAEAPVLELPGLTEDGIANITVGTGSNTLISVFSPGFRIDEVKITEGSSAFGAGALFITNSTNLGFSSWLQPTAKTNTNGTRIVIEAVQSNSNGTISASREFQLRLAAPVPTRLLGTNVFEVDVGRLFSTNIQTDAGNLADISFSNLPSGLEGFANGTISGTNRSTTLPYEFDVRVRADSSARYLGGGVFTSSVTLRLRNPDPPVFANATNRIFVATGRSASVGLMVSNFPFLFESSNLPAGLSISGTRIVGTPLSGGIARSDLIAYNSLRPGLTNNRADWKDGSTILIFHVADAKPVAGLIPATLGSLPRNSAISTSDNVYLIPGGAENAEVRVSAFGLPPGLSLDAATGKLFGTTGGSGSYTATVFIQNGRGWIKKNVTLTVQ